MEELYLTNLISKKYEIFSIVLVCTIFSTSRICSITLKCELQNAKKYNPLEKNKYSQKL
jgi:hypothetical protein